MKKFLLFTRHCQQMSVFIPSCGTIALMALFFFRDHRAMNLAYLKTCDLNLSSTFS